MKYCGNCGNPVQDDDMVCTQCGAPIRRNAQAGNGADSQAAGNNAASESGQDAVPNTYGSGQDTLPDTYGSGREAGANTYSGGQDTYGYGNAQNGYGNSQGAYGSQQNGCGSGQGTYGNPQNTYGNAQNPGGGDGQWDYTPISMWGYFGYELLFMIPCVGLILLLVFSFGGTRRINLRNFARSYFCLFIIGAVLSFILYLYGASHAARYYW